MATITRLPLPKSNEALQRTIRELKQIKRCNEGDVVFVTPMATHGDGKIYVSAEDGGWFANYYGENDNGDPAWIHPMLIKWAADRGWFWEWENPGAIYLTH